MLAVAANTSFVFEPGAIALVAVLGGVYGRRWLEVRRHDGPRGAPVGRLAWYVLGLVLLFAALLSPIDSLADQVFGIHMVQHVILLDFVPICFMLGQTKVLLRPLTRRLQRLEASPVGHPAVAVGAYVTIMWLWHLPALYDLALEHSMIHVFEHVCFLSVGLGYWWHLLSPVRSRRWGGPFGPVVYMLATKLLVGILGIAITFAPRALYGFYAHQGEVWGLSPHDDQALAGVIMATEQSVVMGIALAWLFVRALAESERADQRAERYGTA